MKIKVLLAQYLAWVVLAVLALILLYAAVTTFSRNTSYDQLKDEISRYEGTVREGMRQTTAPRTTPPDYIDALKVRLDHLPVINRYEHNPFVVSPEVEYPLIQFAKGQTLPVRIKGVRFTEVTGSGEPYVGVAVTWEPEDETGVVTFKALEPGDFLKDHPVTVMTQDNVTYRFSIMVLKEPIASPPLPPLDVTVAAHAKTEAAGATEPAMVLITFSPDNSHVTSGETGPTNGANIYRKPAGAPESEYHLLQMIHLITPEEIQNKTIQNLWMRFYPQPSVAPASPPPPPPVTGEPLTPEPATSLLPSGPTESANAAPPLPRQGAFVFLDDTVDDGETYDYKIETLNLYPGLKSGVCKNPYILRNVVVPSLVEFVVQSVANGRATLTLSRLDPETGQRRVQAFTVVPGMKIGGIASVRLTEGGRVSYKDIDFSTNCILVAALSSYKDISYDKVHTAKTGPEAGSEVFAVRRLVRDPTILYVTPRGSLRLKSKSEGGAFLKEIGAPGEAPPRRFRAVD